jgi:hypothetical protein
LLGDHEDLVTRVASDVLVSVVVGNGHNQDRYWRTVVRHAWASYRTREVAKKPAMEEQQDIEM